MAEFFSSRLLRWLIVPYRSRLVVLRLETLYQVADRILGTQFLEDVAQFFILFQSMYDGFVERARAVHRLMADRRTSFIVVSTLEAVPLREAGVLCPIPQGSPAASRCDRPQQGASRLPARSPPAGGGREVARPGRPVRRGIAPKVRSGDVSQIRRVLAEVGRSYLDYRVVAQREAEQQAELSTVPEALVSVPYFETDVYDLAGLLRLGERLWRS